MAESLGSLVVRLGLDAAEFTTGLTKAEADAKKLAAKIDRGIATAANAAAIGIAAIGTAAVAAFAAIDQLVKQAGNFQDLAEATGADAEALASFAVSAKVAGLEMQSIADASVKLTKNLQGVDDESKAAGAALSAIGIPIKEFKALDPATQIETVAKALAGFDDGASKVAVSLALFGKSGAQLLPFLKELANEGGRQVILTREQIQLADEYADKQARVTAQINLYAQSLAVSTLPAINAVTKAGVEFVKSLLVIDSTASQLEANKAIELWAERVARAIAFVVDAFDGLIRIGQEAFIFGKAALDQADALASKDFKRISEIGAAWKKEAAAILNRPLFSTKIEEEFAALKKFQSGRAREDRGFTPAGRQINFAGAEKEAKAIKEKTTEADRYLESLQRQIEKTNELSTVEQVLLDLQKGRIEGLKPGQLDNILAIAQQIDAYKELEKWVKESNKAFEEEVRISKQMADDRTKAAEASLREAEHIAEANDQLRDEIAIIAGGEKARIALEQNRVANAIAIKEEALAMLQLDPLRQSEAENLRIQIDLLKERSELLTGREVVKAIAAEAQALQDVQNMFADTFANAFADFITGTKSAKDAFKSFVDDLTRQISRIASQNIANALFGGTNKAGPDIFGVLAKLAGSFFGGGSGGSIFGGPQFGSFGVGTSFAPGGMAMVGERGPELVNLPRGSQVTSAGATKRMTAGATTIHQTINVLPGADHRSAIQAGNAAGRGARLAMWRNS